MNLLFAIWSFILIIAIYIVLFRRNTILTIVNKLIRNSRKKKINLYVSRYKQSFSRGKSSSTSTVVIPLILMLIVAIAFYKFAFFAVPVSNSMIPTFTRGDLVLYQKYNTTPEVGDIIMFELLGKDYPITHRVHSMILEEDADGELTTYIETKGDNGGVDPWRIYPRYIYAKAVTIDDKPIVIKYVGSYMTGELQSGTENTVFKAMSTVLQKGRELGLAIFSICILLYLLISVHDMSSQRRYKRR